MNTLDAEQVHENFRNEIRRLRKNLARVIGSMVVLMLITIGSLIVYSNHVGDTATKNAARAVQVASERQAADLRKFCELLRTLDVQPGDPPVTTARAQKIVNEIRGLIVAYDCPEVK